MMSSFLNVTQLQKILPNVEIWFIRTSTYEQKSFVAVYTKSKSFMYCLKIWQGKSWLLDDSF